MTDLDLDAIEVRWEWARVRADAPPIEGHAPDAIDVVLALVDHAREQAARAEKAEAEAEALRATHDDGCSAAFHASAARMRAVVEAARAVVASGEPSFHGARHTAWLHLRAVLDALDGGGS